MSHDLTPFVVEGELASMQHHALCGDDHTVMSDGLLCCCGEIHDSDPFVCCSCGHHHEPDRGCMPPGPCGSYVCCVP